MKRNVRRSLLGIILLGIVLTGCANNTYAGCTATNTCPESTQTVYPDNETTHKRLVKQLEAAGFQNVPSSSEVILVKENDKVVFTGYINGYIVIGFPEGSVLCRTIGADAGVFDPLRYITAAKTAGYQKTLQDQSSLCEAQPKQ
jgi:hypothetical protein